MAWIKLDDAFTDHPKIEALSDRAFRLHVAGLCHCGRMLTDGFIATDRVRRLLPKVSKMMVDELVNARLWEPVNGGFGVVDFLEYNPSRAKVKADREEAAERKRRWLERQGTRSGTRSERGGRNAAPTRPDPSRPEGSRDGSTGSPLSVVPSPAPSGGDGRQLDEETVVRNVEEARAARKRLRGEAS